LKAAAPPGKPDPTSRSQTSLLIRTLKRNYAVIPKVTFSYYLKTLGSN